MDEITVTIIYWTVSSLSYSVDFDTVEEASLS
jgi:hypothetical protein